MAKDVIIIPADGDIQFKNEQGTESGRIAQSGDNLVFSNAVGDVLLGDGSSDIYVGDGINNVDIVFEQDGEIRGEVGSGVTLTLGSNDTTLYVTGSTLAFQKDGGNVGIGTTSPSRPLHVIKSGDNEVARFESDQTTCFVELEDVNTTGQILLGTQGNDFKIHTGGSERMRIDGNGNVGIGTTDPSYTLEVAGPDSSTGTIKWKNAGSRKPGYLYSDSAGVAIYDTTLSTAGIYLAGNNRIDFRVNSSERMRIDSTGAVGIGTTSPGYKLDVDGDIGLSGNIVDANTGEEIQIGTNDIRVELKHLQSEYGLWARSPSLSTRAMGIDGASTYMGLYTNSTEKVRITSDGNVGIGTTSPEGLLQISRDASTAYDGTNDSGQSNIGASLTIQNPNTTTNSFAQVNMQVSADSNRAVGRIVTIAKGGASSDMAFVTENTGVRGEKVRIASDGNVGIGTTTPSATLTVGGEVHISSSNAIGKIEGTTGGNLVLNNTTGEWQFKANGSSVNSATINASLITLNEDVYATGDVGIGTNSPVGKLNIVTGTSGVTMDIANQANGSFSFSNNAGGAPLPTLIGRSDSSIGISLIGATSDTNTNGDMSFNVRENDNTDFSTLTSTAFSFGRYSTKLLTILRNGAVGIGTSSPGYTLEVDGGTDNTIASFVSTDAGSFISFVDDSTTSGEYVQIGAVGNELAIRTNNASVVRIDDSGNVGIGTTTPSAKLTVEETGTSQESVLRLIGTNTSDAASQVSEIVSYQKSGGAAQETSLDFRVRKNADAYASPTTVMTLTDGAVGIGTTTPSAKLDIEGGAVRIGGNAPTGSVASFLYLDAPASKDSVLNFHQAGSQVGKLGYDASLGGIAFVAGAGSFATADAVILDNGNFGIGTTSPQSPLHIYTGDGGTYSPNTNHDDLTIEGSTNIGLQLFSPATTYQYIAFGDPGSVNAGYIRYYHGTNEMVFRTNGGDRVTIDNSGNTDISGDTYVSGDVGIGTTSPNNELEILGSNSPRISLRTSNEAVNEALELGFQVGTGANASSNSVGLIKSVITQATPSALIGDMEFQTNSGDAISTKMIIKGDGNVGINMDSPISSLHIGDGNDTVSSVLYSTDILNISAQNTAPGFNIISAGSSEFNRGVFKATRSRGTLASPTAAVNGDYIFSLLGVIYDGGAGRATAGVEMRADGTVSSGNAPQRIEFQTGLTTSRSTRMTIKSNGNVGINTTSPGTDLDVNGDTTTDNLYLATNIIHEGNTNTKIGFGTNTINLSTSTLSTSLSIGSTGTITLGDYGSGTKTGTAAYTLAVDSSGNIIETSGGGGGESFQDVTDTGNTTTNDITIGASSTPTATLNIVGNGTGDTTDALLVENSGLTDLFKITDSGNFYMRHSTRSNSIIINNNDTTGTGASCTLIGDLAGYGSNLNGGFLTAVGRNAAYNSTGGGNSTIMGGYAAYACGNLFGTVAIGSNAGRSASNAYYNTAVGSEACNGSSLRYSVAIGAWAGRGTGTSLQDRNIYIGYQTAYNSNLNDGNTVIGARLQSGSTEGLSNTVIIGSDNAERLRIDSTGKFKFDSYGAGSFTGTQTVNLEADSSGNVIERLEERGTFSVSTDGTGDGSFSHSLGETPTIVLMTCDSIGGTVTTICVTGKSSTTISVKSSQRNATVTGYYIVSS